MAEVLVHIDAPAGEVRVGDTVLPGAYQSLEVRREVELDERKVKGRSGKSKQPQGFNDAEVELSLVVHQTEKTPYEQVAVLTGVFQRQDAQARPFVYSIAHPLLAAWQIRLVVFRNLTTRDDNASDLIQCRLSFVEHRPVMLKKEGRRAKRAPTAVDGEVFTPTTGLEMSMWDQSTWFSDDERRTPEMSPTGVYGRAAEAFAGNDDAFEAFHSETPNSPIAQSTRFVEVFAARDDDDPTAGG